jgi:hypothetical protein
MFQCFKINCVVYHSTIMNLHGRTGKDLQKKFSGRLLSFPSRILAGSRKKAATTRRRSG